MNQLGRKSATLGPQSWIEADLGTWSPTPEDPGVL